MLNYYVINDTEYFCDDYDRDKKWQEDRVKNEWIRDKNT